jgi:hypothetical protein
VNPENRVVKLCAAGIAAEGDGRKGAACALYAEAWSASTDALESCIAAHYVARCAASAEERFGWNETALRRAGAAPQEHVRGFYPSLHLNFAASLEELGRLADAHAHYAAALRTGVDLPDTPYLQMIRGSAAAGCERTREAHQAPVMPANPVR